MLSVVLILMIVYHLAVGLVVYHYDSIRVVPRRSLVALFIFAKHEEVKFFALNLARIVINTGPSLLGFAVIGYFIPPLDVETVVLVVIGILGIIMSLSGYYIERALKN